MFGFFFSLALLRFFHCSSPLCAASFFLSQNEEILEVLATLLCIMAQYELHCATACCTSNAIHISLIGTVVVAKHQPVVVVRLFVFPI